MVGRVEGCRRGRGEEKFFKALVCTLRFGVGFYEEEVLKVDVEYLIRRTNRWRVAKSLLNETKY